MTRPALPICIAGVSGRLGRRIAAEILERSDVELVGGMVSSDSAHLGADLGEIAGRTWLGRSAKVALEDACAGAAVVIEVSAPAVTAAIARRLADRGKVALVTGTTGLSRDDQDAVARAAEVIPVLQASNFSLGVALAERLVAQAARALDPDRFDLEIVEAHHNRKVDLPSGTALSLGRAAAQARGQAFGEVAVFHRSGPDSRRRHGDIGFASLRGGGVVGEHSARFISDLEEVVISHQAFDRAVFARGAVEAALWLADKPVGIYSMQDVLGLD